MKNFSENISIQNMRRYPLFFYFVLGVIILALSGEWTSKQNIYENSSRFHQWISADSQHFPSSDHVYNWSRAQIKVGQKVVVIGGSSVLIGAGQSEIDSFSNQLKLKLGNDFAVLNLALNGGGTFGQGSYVADKLRSEGFDVVLVADFLPLNTPPYMNYDRYQYFYWDAKHSGLIPKDHPLLTRLVKSNISQSEMLMLINSKLHFLDLFNYVSVRYVKLNHSPLFGDLSLRPLGDYEDSATSTLPENSYPFDQADLKITRDMANQDWNMDVLNSSIAYYRGYFVNSIEDTLLLFCHNSPRYVNRLKPIERLKYREATQSQLSAYNFNGLKTIQPCSDFVDTDYIDRIHLSNLGAAKMAEKISVWVRSKYEDKK